MGIVGFRAGFTGGLFFFVQGLAASGMKPSAACTALSIYNTVLVGCLTSYDIYMQLKQFPVIKCICIASVFYIRLSVSQFLAS